MTNTATIVARRLYDVGCRHAFGIPGGEVLKIMEALQDAGIHFQLAKHENSAGFMAEGAHHATGAPGILLATLGPGVANAVNVVANAWQDQVPMIFLTGCVDDASAVTYTHQIFDHQALLRPITKASFKLNHGATAAIIDKAIAIATNGRPGPVHIDIPISVAGMGEIDKGYPRQNKPSPMVPAQSTDFQAAKSALELAKKPLIIAGIDILHQKADQTLRDFIEKFQIPLITTYKAKGVLDEDHNLSLGGAGLSPVADNILLDLIKQSDLIILAGYDPIEMRAGWRQPWGPDTTTLEFSAVTNTHYVHQSDYSFIGDVASGLAALSKNIDHHPTWADDAPNKTKQALHKAFLPKGNWGPAHIIQCLRRVLPKNTVATVDTGAHRILLSQIWHCYSPRTLLQSTALCTMGPAVPMATGYKTAKLGVPVVAFTGDAGMEMVLGELATLRDMELPVLVIVFVDRSLALIELKQRGQKMENLGVDFGGTDFAAVATAMGGTGVDVSDAETLEAEAAKAISRNGFTLLACPIDRKAYDGLF